MRSMDWMEMVLSLALDAGASEAEVILSDSESLRVGAYQGGIEQFSRAQACGAGLRLRASGRVGSAFTEKRTEADAQLLVQRAVESAAIAGEEDEPPFAGGGALADTRPCPAFDAQAMRASALALEQAALAVDARVTRVPHCSVQAHQMSFQLRGTNGLSLHVTRAFSLAAAEAIAQQGEDTQSASAFDAGFALADIDFDRIARAASGEAVRLLGARSVHTGTYPVVLRWDMMCLLMEAFAGAFSAEAAQKKVSALIGKEGARVAAPLVQLWDDAANRALWGCAAFDDEGAACSSRPLIENGVFQGFLHNRKTAARAGVCSTGNAMRGSYGTTLSVAPHQLTLRAGQTKESALRTIAPGALYITELQGIHTVSALTGDFSLAAKGFLCEPDGTLGQGVSQVTVAGNFFTLLERIEALGNVLHQDAPSFGTCVAAPDVLVSALTVAGR